MAAAWVHGGVAANELLLCAAACRCNAEEYTDLLVIMAALGPSRLYWARKLTRLCSPPDSDRSCRSRSWRTWRAGATATPTSTCRTRSAPLQGGVGEETTRQLTFWDAADTQQLPADASCARCPACATAVSSS